MRRVQGILVAVLLFAARAVAMGEAGIPAASSADHLWLVVPRLNGSAGWALLHHAADMNGPYARDAWPLTDLPSGIAAWGDSVWIAYRARASDALAGWEVVGLSTVLNPLTNQYFNEPADRLETFPTLAAAGRMFDFIGSPKGPVALMADVGPAERGCHIHALENSAWVDLGGPALTTHGIARLAWLGGPEGSPRVVEWDGSRGQVVVWTREPESGEWQIESSVIVQGEVTDVTVIQDQLAVLSRLASGEFRADLIRPERPVSVATFRLPPAAWGFGNDGDRLALVGFSLNREALLVTIDVRNGAVSPPAAILEPVSKLGHWVHVPVFGALTLLVVLLAMMMEQFANRPKATVTRLPLSARCLALFIDVLIGGGLAMVILQCEPGDLLHLPSWTLSWKAAQPAILMGVLTVLHTFVGELIAGRSVGLWLMGGRVRDLQGRRPGPVALLIRNTLRLLTILSPALAIIPAFNRSGETAGDLLGRVQVVEDQNADDTPGAKPADPAS